MSLSVLYLLYWIFHVLKCLWEVYQSSFLIYYWYHNTWYRLFGTSTRRAWDWFYLRSFGLGLKIVPYLYFFRFCPSAFSSSLFTCLITLWAYLCAELGLIYLLVLRLPMPWSTCCGSLARIVESLGGSCEPYISCFHNVCFFFFDKVIFWSGAVLDYCKRYHFSNSFLGYFANFYEVPQVLHRRTFKWREWYI